MNRWITQSDRSPACSASRRGRILAGVVLLAASLVRLPAADPRLFAPGFRTDQWKVEQGLPQNTVQCLLQTRDGYLWAGTRFGLLRYDGLTPIRYDHERVPAMKNDNCVALAETDDGLWVGTSGGLLRWRDRAWSGFTTADGLCDNRIWALTPAHAGGVWIGTADGLSRCQAGQFSTLKPASPSLRAGETVIHNDVGQLCEDTAGTLWIANQGGLQRLRPDGQSFERIAAQGLIQQLVADPAGGVWWIDAGQVYQFKADRLVAHAPPAPGEPLALLHFDRQGVLWAATARSACFQLRPDGWQAMPVSPFLAEQTLRCLLDDREGSLWLGTELGGLFRVQPRRLRTYTVRDGLAGPDVWSVCGAPDGSVWFSTRSGLSQLRDGVFRNFPATGPEAYRQLARTLWVDRQATLWGATSKSIQGLSRFDQEAGQFVRVMDRAKGEPLGRLLNGESFYEDRSGTLWAGTDQGVLRLEEGEWRRVAGSPLHVRAMLQDRAGDLWLGTADRGLYRWRASQGTNFTRQAGLPGDAVWVIHEDQAGGLWCAGDRGLTRLRAGGCATITRQQGLYDNLINQLFEDDQGRFWLGCNRGIFRVPRHELDAVADGKTNRVHCVVYGEADGMAAAETNGENQPAGYQDARGHLWFPTINGVVELDPRTLRDNPVPPPVLIEQVRANGQAVAGDFAPAGAAAGLATRATPSSTLRFAPGTARALEIRYTATSLVSPDQVHFKYRLLGFGSDWLEDADNRRVVSYANLRPGRYTFQVTACNNHGLWNDTGAEQTLELLPYFYETAWFYALCAALVALAIWTAHRLRVRVLARLQVLEHQHALDRERARIAHDIHDDLGSRLSQIAILGELADRSLASPEGARHQLDKMRATTGEVFQALDEIVWTTNPKQDSVAGLVSYLREYAPEFLGAAGLTCRLDFPSPIPAQPLSAEARHHLFLTVKEALNNIVKHAQATEVSLRLRLENRTLTLVLQDTGCGLTVANPQPPTLGNGLANMRERITSLGGKFTLHSEPGSGTRIQFQIPL